MFISEHQSTFCLQGDTEAEYHIPGSIGQAIITSHPAPCIKQGDWKGLTCLISQVRVSKPLENSLGTEAREKRWISQGLLILLSSSKLYYMSKAVTW